MSERKRFDIAVLPGDGIGIELLDACLKVLKELEKSVSGFYLSFEHIDAGASFYQKSGQDITKEGFERAREADAILLGAMGHPDIRYPDGTEIAPHLKMRTEYDLFASVRPVKAFKNVPRPLADPRAADIDLVIIRECSEGLFYLRHEGQIINDQEARDTLVITRKGCERLFDFAFQLAQQRKEKGGKGMVSCVDKSNVLRSYAFFLEKYLQKELNTILTFKQTIAMSMQWHWILFANHGIMTYWWRRICLQIFFLTRVVELLAVWGWRLAPSLVKVMAYSSLLMGQHQISPVRTKLTQPLCFCLQR